MQHYALIDQKMVVCSVVLWDGSTPWECPSGLTLILAEGLVVGPGYTYNGTTFVYGTAPDDVPVTGPEP